MFVTVFPLVPIYRVPSSFLSRTNFLLYSCRVFHVNDQRAFMPNNQTFRGFCKKLILLNFHAGNILQGLYAISVLLFATYTYTCKYLCKYLQNHPYKESEFTLYCITLCSTSANDELNSGFFASNDSLHSSSYMYCSAKCLIDVATDVI